MYTGFLPTFTRYELNVYFFLSYFDSDKSQP